MVLEEPVQAAHQLVALRPLPRLRVPVGERLPVRGVAEEVRAGAVRAVPVRQHLRRVVEVFPVARLRIEHDERLQDRHRRQAVHAERARVVQPQPAPAQHADPLVHLADDRTEDRPVARRPVRRQHAPDRVLAVPQVPDGVPAVELHRARRVGDRDELLVPVRAEVAVRVLERHQAAALLPHEREERGILQVVGDARGAQHELAPELAAPEAASFAPGTEPSRTSRSCGVRIASPDADARGADADAAPTNETASPTAIHRTVLIGTRGLSANDLPACAFPVVSDLFCFACRICISLIFL